MPSMQSQHPIHSNESIRIDVLARDLQLSVTAILQCAAEGMIPLFFSIYPHDYACISAHKKRIDADQDASPPTANAKKAKTRASLKPETKVSIKGISMGVDEIEGVVLSLEDCQQLVHRGGLSQRYFPAAVWKNMGAYEVLWPTRGLGTNTTPSDADEWQIACYDKAQTADSNIDGRFPALINFDIKSWQLFATGEDVHRFIDIIHHSPECISSLLQHDKDTGLTDVIAERPAYFSEKLLYLIEASERFWRTKTPIDPSEYEDRRKKVFTTIGSDDFKSLFVKEKLHPGTREAAAKFIEPVFAREKAREDLKEGWTSYLSPELCKLMAAAKLFWSAPDVVLDEVLTHPKKEDIEAYFRAVGISGNDTSAAVTLIRPEGAARGGNGTPRSEPGFERTF